MTNDVKKWQMITSLQMDYATSVLQKWRKNGIIYIEKVQPNIFYTVTFVYYRILFISQSRFIKNAGRPSVRFNLIKTIHTKHY